MARQISDGVLKCEYVPTIGDISGPTVAEVGAGTDLTPFLTRDGLDTPSDASVADNSDMSSAFNKTAPGTYGGSALTLELYRDDTADTAWDLLLKDVAGFIVVRYFGGSGVALALADKVAVFPITVITRSPKVGENTVQKFDVECAVTGDIDLDAVVAA